MATRGDVEPLPPRRPQSYLFWLPSPSLLVEPLLQLTIFAPSKGLAP